jgi:hypothetical protein
LQVTSAPPLTRQAAVDGDDPAWSTEARPCSCTLAATPTFWEESGPLGSGVSRRRRLEGRYHLRKPWHSLICLVAARGPPRVSPGGFISCSGLRQWRPPSWKEPLAGRIAAAAEPLGRRQSMAEGGAAWLERLEEAGEPTDEALSYVHAPLPTHRGAAQPSGHWRQCALAAEGSAGGIGGATSWPSG